MLAYLVIAAWPPPSAALPFAGAVLVVIVTMILIALSARAFDRASRARLHAFLSSLRDVQGSNDVQVDARYRAGRTVLTGRVFWIGAFVILFVLARLDEVTLGLYRLPLMAATVGVEFAWLVLCQRFSS